MKEHFESPEHAINVIRRMLHVSGMVLDDASPSVLGHLSKNIRIAVLKTPLVDEDVGVASFDPNCESPEHEETGLYKGRNGNQSDAGFFIGVHPVWNLCVCGGSHKLRKNHTVRLASDHNSGR